MPDQILAGRQGKLVNWQGLSIVLKHGAGSQFNTGFEISCNSALVGGQNRVRERQEQIAVDQTPGGVLKRLPDRTRQAGAQAIAQELDRRLLEHGIVIAGQQGEQAR